MGQPPPLEFINSAMGERALLGGPIKAYMVVHTHVGYCIRVKFGGVFGSLKVLEEGGKGVFPPSELQREAASACDNTPPPIIMYAKYLPWYNCQIKLPPRLTRI